MSEQLTGDASWPPQCYIEEGDWPARGATTAREVWVTLSDDERNKWLDQEIDDTLAGREAIEDGGERGASGGETSARARSDADPLADDNLSAAIYPEPMAPAAFHGWAGEVIRVIAPHSEADPQAILVQLLVAAGAMFGRHGPYAQVESTKHYTNEFALVVGESAFTRKGTSGDHATHIITRADPAFSDHIRSGLSTGEGLIQHVRDATMHHSKSGEDETGDPGVTDKRLLCYESEFAGPLAVMRRDNSTLSAKIRAAWDNGNIATLTRRDPIKATNAHIAILGHTTWDDLKALPLTETRNGFINRFLIVCATRQQLLPDGNAPPADQMERCADSLRHRLALHSRTAPQRVTWDTDTRDEWAHLYRTELGVLPPEIPKELAPIVARAAPHVLRLTLIYTFLAGDLSLSSTHLASALAVWRYCLASAVFVFGRQSVDADLRRVVAVLTKAGPGVPVTSSTFYNDIAGLTAERLTMVMTNLIGRGLVTTETVETKGRPRTTYTLVDPSRRAKAAPTYTKGLLPPVPFSRYDTDERAGMQEP